MELSSENFWICVLHILFIRQMRPGCLHDIPKVVKLVGNQTECPNFQAAVFPMTPETDWYAGLYYACLAAGLMQVYRVYFDLLPQSICLDAYFAHSFWVTN